MQEKEDRCQFCSYAVRSLLIIGPSWTENPIGIMMMVMIIIIITAIGAVNNNYMMTMTMDDDDYD